MLNRVAASEHQRRRLVLLVGVVAIALLYLAAPLFQEEEGRLSAHAPVSKRRRAWAALASNDAGVANVDAAPTAAIAAVPLRSTPAVVNAPTATVDDAVTTAVVAHGVVDDPLASVLGVFGNEQYIPHRSTAASWDNHTRYKDRFLRKHSPRACSRRFSVRVPASAAAAVTVHSVDVREVDGSPAGQFILEPRKKGEKAFPLTAKPGAGADNDDEDAVTFTVRLSPTVVGTHRARVTVRFSVVGGAGDGNSDADGGVDQRSYVFDIEGKGTGLIDPIALARADGVDDTEYECVVAVISAFHLRIRRDEISKSWASAATVPPGIKVVFLTDWYPVDRTLEQYELIPLGYPGYGDFDRIKSMIKYMHTRFPRARFVLKADDDAYVALDNLLKRVRVLDADKHIVEGQPQLNQCTGIHYLLGGAGYLFSRGMIARMSEKAWSTLMACPIDRCNKIEDTSLGNCVTNGFKFKVQDGDAYLSQPPVFYHQSDGSMTEKGRRDRPKGFLEPIVYHGFKNVFCMTKVYTAVQRVKDAHPAAVVEAERTPRDRLDAAVEAELADQVHALRLKIISAMVDACARKEYSIRPPGYKKGFPPSFVKWGRCFG